MKATVYANILREGGETTQETTQKDGDCTINGETCTINCTINRRPCTITIPVNVKEVLLLVLENQRVTVNEMSARSGLSQRTVKYQLSFLKTKGLLKRVGANKNGHWEIIANEQANDE